MQVESSAKIRILVLEDEPDLQAPLPATLVEELEEAVPGLPIVLSLRPERQDLAQACILAGARAYVLRSPDPQELALVIRQVQGKEIRRRKLVSASGGECEGRIITV